MAAASLPSSKNKTLLACFYASRSGGTTIKPHQSTETGDPRSRPERPTCTHTDTVGWAERKPSNAKFCHFIAPSLGNTYIKSVFLALSAKETETDDLPRANPVTYSHLDCFLLYGYCIPISAIGSTFKKYYHIVFKYDYIGEKYWFPFSFFHFLYNRNTFIFLLKNKNYVLIILLHLV